MKNVVKDIVKSLDDAVGHHLNAECNPNRLLIIITINNNSQTIPGNL